MRQTALIVKLVTLCALASLAHKPCSAQILIDTDFSRGSFAALGWKASGDWDIFTYPKESANNPGPVARFAANKPDGSLTKTFAEVTNPRKLTLSLEYGWGWGDANQGSDSVCFMLLDPRLNGYYFELHRTKASWAVQWARVMSGTPAKDKTWAPREIDASHAAIRDGGGLCRLTIIREADGSWSITSKAWDKGSGPTVRFTDAGTTSFSQVVLLGTKNFDEQVFNKIALAVTTWDPADTTAVPASDFLNSVGVVSTFPDRGQPLPRTVEMVKYTGFRWVRGGIEGLKSQGPTTLQTYLDLHRQSGVRFSWGLVSGGTDLKKLIETARPLAAAGALLAFEGNNEPNNWGVTYQGEQGGGRAPSWRAVAKLQRDLYKAVKSDATLKNYPIWSISEPGAEIDNVGLQFLTIPAGAGTTMPAGTKYADCANVHNYIYHPNSAGLDDNKTWNAADPTSACRIDGLYGNHGLTWAKHFTGYSESDLVTLPRVTTETGCTIDGPITEDIQAKNLLSMYLDQFTRGWSHTAVYLLRDREDEGGNQSFGFFKRDYTPRRAAVYLHNLTTILADKDSIREPGKLKYSIPGQPATVHDLLLQKSEGAFELVVWAELAKGSADVTVRLGRAFPSVKMYDPTVGTSANRILRSVDSIKLTLSDHPVILEIEEVPAGAPGAGDQK
jgi:hypothetical protein